MALLLVLEYGVYSGMLGLGEVAWEISSSTQLILWNETISHVRGESAQYGEICFPPQGLVLPGNSTDIDIGVDLLGLKYWG